MWSREVPIAEAQGVILADDHRQHAALGGRDLHLVSPLATAVHGGKAAVGPLPSEVSYFGGNELPSSRSLANPLYSLEFSRLTRNLPDRNCQGPQDGHRKQRRPRTAKDRPT